MDIPDWFDRSLFRVFLVSGPVVLEVLVLSNCNLLNILSSLGAFESSEVSYWRIDREEISSPILSDML